LVQRAAARDEATATAAARGEATATAAARGEATATAAARDEATATAAARGEATATAAARGEATAAATAEVRRMLVHWREAVPDDRMAHLVKDATRALVRALQTRLARFDVPFGHWAFLRILWEADGITQRELSELAGVMQPTTSAALAVMERRGLVVRRRRPEDRRRIGVFLTRRGRALEATLVPLAVEVNRVALRGASRADIATTRRTLLRVLENLAADTDTSPIVAVSPHGGGAPPAAAPAPGARAQPSTPSRRHKATVAR
jgi:DNA-binding MarR family transcriptional regulator